MDHSIAGPIYCSHQQNTSQSTNNQTHTTKEHIKELSKQGLLWTILNYTSNISVCRWRCEREMYCILRAERGASLVE